MIKFRQAVNISLQIMPFYLHFYYELTRIILKICLIDTDRRDVIAKM